MRNNRVSSDKQDVRGKQVAITYWNDTLSW